MKFFEQKGEETDGTDLYGDKKDVDVQKMKREEKEQRERERARKESSREGQNKEETIMRMIKENYMFLLSVVLLSLALILKVVYL